MKTYTQLKEEMKHTDGIVWSFGRFQCPHKGHDVLINTVLSLASDNKYDSMIYTSQSQDNKNNPLSWDDKVNVLSKMFPDVNISRNKMIINPFVVLTDLIDKGYKNVIMVVGSDRLDEFQKNMPKYTKTFDTFQIVSAGERAILDISSTNMREYARNNDFISFNAGLPKSYNDGQKLFQLVQKGMRNEI